jgi:hypothetical protein
MGCAYAGELDQGGCPGCAFCNKEQADFKRLRESGASSFYELEQRNVAAGDRARREIEELNRKAYADRPHLDPCPFCGEDRQDQLWRSRCRSCDSSGLMARRDNQDDELARAMLWNERSGSTADRPRIYGTVEKADSRLMSCPFCLDANAEACHIAVTCNTCGAMSHGFAAQSHKWDSEKYAIASWNRRPAPPGKASGIRQPRKAKPRKP